ncbi:amiloride-sensitive sodium channel subunit alpha-like [Lineus longissimus]|uniref:amiloride-sensitive sodium channel subunit alpha-like n=1 Tax=Lineus longissimus TaxID=88925 RepID=UPI002B4E7302
MDPLEKAAEQQKQEQDVQESFSQKAASFLSDSSVVPLTRMYKSSSVFTKFAWCATFLFAVGMFTFYMESIIRTYFNYPSEVNIKLMISPTLDFPAITICNMNPIRLNQLMKHEEILKMIGVEDIDKQKNMMYERYEDEHRHPGSGETGTAPGSGETGTAPDPVETGTAPDPVETGTAPGSVETGTAPVLVETGTAPGSVETGTAPGSVEITTAFTNPAAGLATTVISGSTTPEYKQWDTLKEMGEDKEREYFGTMDSMYKYQAKFTDLAAALDEEVVEDLTHQIEDFMISCQWQGYPCAPTNFTQFFNFKYGSCWTLNSVLGRGDNWTAKAAPLKTSSTGPRAGLTLVLNVEQYEYVKSLTPEAGVRVVVHQPKEMPFPEDEGFVVSPGFATMVGLRQRMITRLQAPHGTCKNNVDSKTLYSKEFHVDYTVNACQKTCLQNAIYRKCGCALPDIPVPNRTNLTICVSVGEPNNTVHAAMANCTKDVRYRYRSGNLRCNCPQSCSTTYYQTSISTATYPSKHYEKLLKSTLEQTGGGGKEHMDDFDENIVKLVIYFEDLNYEMVETVISYPVEKLLSDFGGLIGLWLGASFITFLELAAFAGDIFRYIARKCNCKSDAEKVQPIMDHWKLKTKEAKESKSFEAAMKGPKKGHLGFENKVFDVNEANW